MSSKILCVIPARGGSKGVPRKNIKPIGSIPLIGYTIKAALSLGPFLDTVLVSSEDEEILNVASRFGAETLRRPKELAEDSVKSEPVLSHALESVEKSKGVRFDGVLLLSPTNPFRSPAYVSEAISLFNTGDFDTIVGLVPIYKYQYRIEGVAATPLFSERRNRQEREPVWVENGALYLTRSNLVREDEIMGPRIGYVAMDELSSINIDSPIDLLHAEAVIEAGLYRLT